MSKLRTTIPNGLAEALKRLPQGYYINPNTGISLTPDKLSLVIDWEHEDWKTPYTNHEPITLEQVEGRSELPPTVKPPAGFIKVTSATVAPARRKVSSIP